MFAKHSLLRAAHTGALVCCALLLARCDFSGISDLENKLDVILAVPGVETNFVGRVVDADTGQLLSVPVQITFTGPNNNLVIDAYRFDPLLRARTDMGVMAFALREGTTPTEASPVRFTVVMEAEGYITTSQPFTISEIGNFEFVTEMVALSNPPEGVVTTVVRSGQTSANGTVTTPVVVQTPTEPNTGGSAAIVVPANTVITDASGQPLTGPLTASVAYFNNQDDESMAAFPGGLSNVTLETAEGISEGAFITAGFTSIEITDGQGRKARNFSQPIEIGMSIPENTINPETDQPVQPGDAIPLWSYNPEDGSWVPEGTVTFERSGAAGKDGDGFVPTTSIVARFQARHLSYWNLDWFARYPAGTCTLSDGGATFNIVGNDSGVPLMLEFKARNGGYYVPTKNLYGDNDPTLFNFPKSLRNVLVTIKDGNTPVGSTTLTRPCGTTSTINVNVPPRNYVDVDINVQVTCPSGVIRPSAYLYYMKQGTSMYQSAYINVGVGRLSRLELGEMYTVLTYYLENDQWKAQSADFPVVGTPNADGVIVIHEDFGNIPGVCDQL